MKKRYVTVYEIQFGYTNAVYWTLNPDLYKDAYTIGMLHVTSDRWREMKRDPKYAGRIMGRNW